jgi:hypothetical protein
LVNIAIFIKTELQKEGDFIKAFWRTTTILVKRPLLIILFSLVMLVFTVADYFSPVSVLSTKIFESGTFGDGNVFEIIVNLLRLILNWILTYKGIIFSCGIILLLALIVGFLLSGYLNMINNSLNENPRTKGEFFNGIKRYFLKTTIITFVTSLLGVILAFIMLIASVPAMVLTTAMLTGNPEYLLGALLVDFVTAGVLFFGIMFFSVYIFFWYAAAINGSKRAFAEGKRQADKNFWGFVRRLLTLYFIFIISQAVFSYMGTAPFPYILRWLFGSVFFSFLISYIMALFKTFEEKERVDPLP